MVKTSSFEKALLAKASAGEWLIGDVGEALPVIRAQYLRAILLRLAPGMQIGPFKTGRVEIAPPGVRIRGATIIGNLDLTDATDVDGQSLPSLALEDCTIQGEILLDHARIDRLSLRDSRVRALHAHQTIFGGTVDLSSVRPWGSDESGCWLVLDGARIDGDLILTNCIARAPAPRKDLDPALTPYYAIQALGIEVLGRVQAMNATAIGGITFSDAVINGEAWFSGTHTTAGERHAFNAQSANFVTGLMLASFNTGRRFEAEGTVWLLGCHAANCDLDGGVFKGGIELGLSKIDGQLTFRNSIIEASEDEIALNASNATIQGVFMLQDCKVRGAGDGWVTAIAINGIKVGDLSIENNEVLGAVSGRLMQVDRDARLFGNQVLIKDSRLRHPLISLDLAQIGGDLQFDPIDNEQHFATRPLVSQGPISIDGADIGGNLVVNRSRLWSGFDGVRSYSFSAINARIGFDASFVKFAAQGTVNLSGISVGRKLRVDLAWPFGSDDELASPARLLWDLNDATALLLCDNAGRGWGMDWPGSAMQRPLLSLDGFEYQSIEGLTTESFDSRRRWLEFYVPSVILPDPKSGGQKQYTRSQAILRDLRYEGSTGSGARARRVWRRARHYMRPDRRAFATQPYLQLAAVYRRNGRDTDADEILRAKMRRDGSVSAQPKKTLWWFFDVLFGLGFRPRNSFLTIAFLLGTGTAATYWANTHGGLAIDASPVATVAAIDRGAGAQSGLTLQPALQIAARNFRTALPCGNAISPPLYAADVFVPLIDLRQETKCEPVGDSWTIAKAFYAILGWIVTSLALLTVSGVLRREAERN